MGIQWKGIELALVLPPLPDFRQKFVRSDAGLRQHAQVKRLEETQLSKGGHTGDMRDADVGRPSTGSGHRQLGVVRFPPGQGDGVKINVGVVAYEVILHL